jgi:hypothetical protein
VINVRKSLKYFKNAAKIAFNPPNFCRNRSRYYELLLDNEQKIVFLAVVYCIFILLVERYIDFPASISG